MSQLSLQIEHIEDEMSNHHTATLQFDSRGVYLIFKDFKGAFIRGRFLKEEGVN